MSYGVCVQAYDHVISAIITLRPVWYIFMRYMRPMEQTVGI